MGGIFAGFKRKSDLYFTLLPHYFNCNEIITIRIKPLIYT